jgi:Zn-dependent protease with chaperone function
MLTFINKHEIHATVASHFSSPEPDPMNFRKVLLLSFLIHLFVSSVSAQDFSKDYVPLSSSGLLPPVFVESFLKKAAEDQTKLIDPNQARLTKKKAFVLASEFSLDHILKGGSVLFNDTISAYLNKVLDEILKNDPVFRKSIQLYVIKSTQVNAFSFDNGILLVNTGLLSQLDDEGQLAFILCHELVHYKRHHSISAYLDFFNVSNQNYHKSKNDLMLEVLNRSKDQETEADTAGLELFRNTNYDYGDIRTAFDVLQYSYLPFDEQEFPRSFFEDGNLRFPKNYFLDKTASVKEDDNYDDQKSTHPNIRKRRANLNSRIEKKEADSGRKKFIVSETAFRQTRDLARFETCRLFLQDLDYPNSIYSAYLLLRKYPANIYLHKIVAKALYEVASYKGSLQGTVNPANIFGLDAKYEPKPYEEIEGFSQQVFYLLHKLSSEEAVVLALNYSWKLNESLHYADPEINSLCDSLFVFLTQGNQKTISDYSKQTRTEILLEDSINKMKSLPPGFPSGEAQSSSLELSKYEKIKTQRKKAEVAGIATNTEDNFSKYAFIGLLKDKIFTDRFQHFIDLERTKANTATEKHDIQGDQSPEPEPGIKKLVIVEPFFYHLNDNKEQKIDFEKTVRGQDRFERIIRENATREKLDYNTIDPQLMKEGDMHTYNDFVCANDWINERLQHGLNVRTLVSGTYKKEDLIARYGTNYFMWTGVFSIKRKGLRRSYTYIYVAVYDLSKETAVFTQTKEMKKRGTEKRLNAYFSKTFRTLRGVNK